MEAVNNQDEAYVENENAKVLDVANGCNESSESESELDESQDSGFDPAIEMSSQTSSQASSTPLEHCCIIPAIAKVNTAAWKNKNVKTISYYIMNKKIKYMHIFIQNNYLLIKYSKIVFSIQKKNTRTIWNDPERSGT